MCSKQQFYSLRRKLGILFTLAVLTSFPAATTIHVSGPYDLNNDGNSEFAILLNQTGGPDIEYREVDAGGQHKTLWSFTAPAYLSGQFTDVKLVDLDEDQQPELVASYLTLGNQRDTKNPWLFIFKWTGNSFRPTPLVLYDQDLNLGRIRPSNIVPIRDEKSVSLAIALGTPERQILLVSPRIRNNKVSAPSPLLFSSKLIKNGYGQVFAGVITTDGKRFLLSLCAEANLLKTSVFDITTLPPAGSKPKEVTSEILVLNGARRLFGPGITVTDENKDGNEELLLPFRNGELLSLSYLKRQLSLTNSSHKDPFLFPGSKENLIATISQVIQARKTPPAPAEIVFPDSIAVIDTLSLGDTLIIATITDTSGEFYSFRWLRSPPAGARFDPASGIINWVPKANQVGLHTFAYQLETRVRETVVRMEDRIGDRHQVVPVLDKETKVFAVLVSDTTVTDTSLPAAKSYQIPPVEMFSVIVTTPQDDDNKRFVFDGVPPFGVTVDEIPAGPSQKTKFIGHHIYANLAYVNQDKQVTFKYSSSEEPQEEKTTITFIHDLENNLLFISAKPKLDTLPQSYHPEAWDPDLYQYPEYFFEGFPTSMSMDSINNSIRFTFGDQQKPEGINTVIALVTPTNPSHYLNMYLKEGRLLGIRGEVRVKENGTKKTITEIDLAGPFKPSLIITRVRGNGKEQQDEKKLLKVLKLIAASPDSVSLDTLLRAANPGADSLSGGAAPDSLVPGNPAPGLVLPDTSSDHSVPNTIDSATDSSGNTNINPRASDSDTAVSDTAKTAPAFNPVPTAPDTSNNQGNPKPN
ncbi:MAG: hypothetical protein GXO92_04235 [FCB group bacterium]|nr:hypothetical protein [FCB group bacterium]